MFRNYLKTAFRSLQRNKSYTFINVAGLAVGIAACLLIFQVIQYENSFDNFHPDKDRIFRVSVHFNTPDGISYARGICFAAGKQLPIDYPRLEQVASIFSAQGNQLTVLDETSHPQNKYKENGLFYIEPQFFDIFHFPFIAGNPKTALSAPNSIVLSQEIAEKYFGDWRKAIGRMIKYQDGKICKVTGILKNPPVNTDFPLKVAMSFKSLENDTSHDWVSTFGDLNTYVKLPPGMSAEKFDASLENFGKKHIPPDYAKKQGFNLQPLSTIHFDKRFGNYNRATFSKELITALSLIGIFLVVIACINFVNLATAQAVDRAKEVGVRKVLGSRKRQLMIQFLSESLIVTVTAVTIAFGIACLILPLLNQLLETKITMHINITMLVFLMVVTILVTLLSGLYPAMVLSGFNPITALKSRFSNRGSGGISLRRGLVVVQFILAEALIICTLIVVSQMNYFKTAQMGFDKEAIVMIPIPSDSVSQTKMTALKTELLQMPDIKNVSFSTFSISDNSHWGSDFNFDNSPKISSFNADLKWADADVFKTFGLQMAAGRPYRPSDTIREFVVNETMVAKLGVHSPDQIIGKMLSFWDGQLKGEIIGVVKDFHSNSLAKPLTPVVMSTWKRAYELMAVKLSSRQAIHTLAGIEKLWNTTYPESVFEYQFLDEKIADFYKQGNQLSQLYKIFAGIAIFISCLGLYGLVSFMATQRTKEIGIRKILGASVGNIIYLFSREFTILVCISFLIAAPLAYYFMHGWLENFTFRISIGAGIFIITILASVSIAWITVGYRAFRAAMANPVTSLRSE
ncbi:MAG TPA: ABC transporter permease [Puia sp.]|nr:ABC transporter permease [Puia sp.]